MLVPLEVLTRLMLCVSDGYTRDEMDFVWNPTKTSLRLKTGLSLPEFQIEDVTNISCGAAFSTGTGCSHKGWGTHRYGVLSQGVGYP